MKTPRPKIAIALLAIGVGTGGILAARQWGLGSLPPGDVALAYARAVYARDYAAAWAFISSTDKQYKTREQYLAENESFTGAEQDLADTLASWIQFTETNVKIEGDRATVTAHVKAPNGNQPEVYEILKAADGEGELTNAERQALFERLQSLYAIGQIEILEGDQIFLLTRQPSRNLPLLHRGNWQMVMEWAGAIVVKLTAEVSPDLPWDFYPLQPEVRTLPGETVRAMYRVINRTDQTITGKAKHFLLPEEFEEYFTSIQCFCMIQQTLKAGESQDMTLLFRIDYDVPAEVRELENRYVYYPLESFPED